MRRKSLLKRVVALALAGVLAFNVAPMGVSAETTEPYDGMEETVPYGYGQPTDVEGFVWVENSKSACSDQLLHSHDDECYKLTCDHKGGHLSTCYSTSSVYEKCTHNDDSEHTGSVEVRDVVTVETMRKSPYFKVTVKEHPAREVIQTEIDDLSENGYPGCEGHTVLGFIPLECTGVTAVYYHIYDEKFCFTETSTAGCNHGKEYGEGHSVIGGDCYDFKSLLEGGCNGLSHEHSIECQYEKYTLYADVNSNGTPDKDDPSYTIKYVNGDTVLQSNTVLEGMPYPAYNGENPTKEADAQYTYTFSGWDVVIPEEGATVTGNITHTAQYNKTVNKYAITWVSDGETLGTSEVEYGAMPEYTGETPVKEAEGKVYTFAGWEPELETVKDNKTYTAKFTEKNVFEVKFNIEGYTTTKYVVEGEKAENYQPTRNYYTLNGWYTDTNCETEFDFETSITAQTVLFAEWVPVNDVNKDGVADEEQACGITVTGDVTAEVSGNKLPGQTITITASPKSGKYITGDIKVNGVVYKTEDFAATKATFSYTLPTDKVANYTFEVMTADVAISLYSEYVGWNALMTAEEAEASVFDNVNWGTMPETVAENTIVEYMEYDALVYKSWKTIGTDDITTLLGVKVGHAFGEKTEETVRFTFAGDNQVPAFTAEFTVSLKDDRLASKINVNDNVTFTYSPSVTDEEMAKAIFDAAFVTATSEDGTVELATVYGENIFVKDAKVDAGTHTVVIDFYGTSEYAASSAEVTVVVEKADSYVNVTEANVKYGTEVNASVLVDTGVAKRVELAVGLSLGEDASEDLSSVVYLNLPMIIDTNALPEIIRPTVEEILDELTSGREISISELGGYLSEITKAVDKIGDFVDLGIDATAISALTSVLENLENIEGVGNVRLIVSMDEDIILKDSGAYLVGAVVTDSNYNTSFGANYVVITPDGYKAVLDWNVKDDNGLVRKDALSTYNFGAKVVEVSEGTIADAQKHVTTFFMGVDANGEATVTYNPTELKVGVYTQIALIKDLGNTMYYAEPIQRVFAVVPQVAEVEVKNDENGKVYTGKPQEAEVTVKLADDSEYDPACLQVTYVGLDVKGEVYNSTVAPTNTGAYTVLATYLEKDANGVYDHAGFDVGYMVISPAEAELDVADNEYVIYDGEEHWPTITNTKNLELVKIVADDKGNVNVILPAPYDKEKYELNAKDAADELVEILKDIYANNANVAVMATDEASANEIMNEVISRLEAIGVDVYEMIAKAMDVESIIAAAEKRAEDAVKAFMATDLDAVKEQVEATLNGIEVKNLSINGVGPIEEGVYTVSVIGYRENYKLAAARGSIEIHEHDWVAANCTTPKTCEECKETEGEALGHTWGEWYVTKKPTKHSKGEERRDCENCEVYQLRELAKLPSGGGSKHDKDDSEAKLEGVYYAVSEPVTITPAKTGDSANVIGYACAVVAAGAALLYVFLKKKRA